MISSLCKNWFEVLLIVGGVVLWMWGVGSHFVWYDIPLGYDPGLYKVWFEQMHALSYRDWSVLSPWVQKMYPPFLGMVGALLMEMGWSSEGLVTRGAVGLSGLLILSLTALSRRFGVGGLSTTVFVLACASFVLYNLWWWGYLKQMLGVVMVLTSLHLLWISWSNPQTISTSVLIGIVLGVGGLTQRPALILCGMIGVCRVVSSVLRTSKYRVVTTALGGGVSLVILASIGGYFWEIQIAPMIAPFLDAIDVPTYQDGYKSGGTFLTMSERLKTDGLMIVGGLIGRMMMRRRRISSEGGWMFMICFTLMLLRVGGQASFYQRMIGYLSPFLIIGCAYALCGVRRYRLVLVGLVAILQGSSTIYWISRSRSPLIIPEELALIRQISTVLPEDAIVLVSGIWYSPRVRGWSGREVIAPGLFDYTVWGREGQGRSDYWIGQSGSDKCTAAYEYFGDLDRPLYAWRGVTQDPDQRDDPCLIPVLSDPSLPTTLYQLNDNRP